MNKETPLHLAAEAIGNMPLEVREAVGPLLEAAVDKQDRMQDIMDKCRRLLPELRLTVRSLQFDLHCTKNELKEALSA